MLDWVRKIGSVRACLLAVSATAVCVLSCSSCSTHSGSGRSDLNLLVVTLDTTRADILGTYGGRAVTPTIDELAKTGVVFEQASTVALLTLPAHTSLFTALFPPGHQVHE